MQILVVDDDPIAVEMVAAILEDSGHQALIAENAIEALETVSEQPNIELVISDNFMPLMNGPELCQELREQGFARPFILLSGAEQMLDEDRQVEISAYLIKDFSLAETLIETINRIMS